MHWLPTCLIGYIALSCLCTLCNYAVQWCWGFSLDAVLHRALNDTIVALAFYHNESAHLLNKAVGDVMM